MERSETIQRQFGSAAARYRYSGYHATAPDLGAMLRAVSLQGDERVLDLGTGTGHTALAFAPHVGEVVALDLTPAMLQQAREFAAERGCTNIRFELGDAMALPFEDSSFDGVTCRVCAHHFADAAAAVRETARVLRPGGWLLLVDSVSPDDAAADTFLNAIELLRDASHVRNHTITQWCDLLEASGFAVEPLETFRVPLDFDDWVERMGTPERVRVQLRRLLDEATGSQRETFSIRTGEHYRFCMPIALLRAHLDATRPSNPRES